MQLILERLDELEQQGVIGAFDKRTIIELSNDVIKRHIILHRPARRDDNIFHFIRCLFICPKIQNRRIRECAFDKRTIIELSNDVIKEIAQKYVNVQKGVGDIMGGALIETSARRLKNEAENETKKQTALKLLKRGKQTVEEIAEDTGLSITEVEQLAGLQTV